MKMLAVRNFFSTSHLYFSSRLNQVCLFSFTFSLSLLSLFGIQSSCLNLIVVQVTVTSEDVCCSIRNIKFINENFCNMRCLVMFITAVCLFILLKLKRPKNKSAYVSLFCYFFSRISKRKRLFIPSLLYYMFQVASFLWL